MKIRTLTVSMAVAGLLAGAAGAAPVSSGDALCAVRGWVALKESLDGAAAGAPQAPVAYEGRAGKGLFYVVPLEGGGYVVTSGDDRSTPVLAYSAGGRFEASEENPLWCLLSGRAAAESVRAESGARALGAAGESANAAKWNRLRAAGASGVRALGASMQAAPADLRVPSLIQSDWSQGRIGNYYGTDFPYCFNMYTPEIDGERAVCGCVATSGAQLMRYFQWPKTSVAAKTKTCKVADVDTPLTMIGGTYDWANMPTNINSMYSQPEADTLAYREAIGKLTYDIGVAVKMQYAADGSGAAESDLANALVDVFGYKNATYASGYGSGLSADKLKKAVIPSLESGRPCGVGIRSSTDDSGHAVVADGYGYSGGTLYVHFNMGWADLYNSNVWYAPPEFDINGSVEYDVIDEVVFNIFTDAGSRYGSIASGRILDKAGNPVAGATVTAATTMLNGVATNIVATSNERGIYALLLPAVDNACTITAACEGYDVSSEVSFTISTAEVPNTYDNDITLSVKPRLAAFLEYIESTGEQYIDTGVKARSGTKAEMDMLWTKQVNGSNGYDTYLATSEFSLMYVGNMWYKGVFGSWSKWVDEMGGTYTGIMKSNTRYAVVTEATADGEWKTDVNGMTASKTGLGVQSWDRTLYMFARNNNNSADQYGAARCYATKIWQTDGNGEYTLVRNFIPCLDTDGVACLYDAVSGGMFVSKTSTPFTAGPVTAEFPDSFVEYVYSDGTQFVDTGIEAKPGTKAEMKIRWLEVGGYTVYLGAWGNTSSKLYCICSQNGQWFYFGLGGANFDKIEENSMPDHYSIKYNWWQANADYNVVSEVSSGGDFLFRVSGGYNSGADEYGERKGVSVSAAGYSFYLFAMGDEGTAKNHSKVRCYGTKIWQTDSSGEYRLVRDFRPCIKAGRPGLYDAVSKRIFYSSSGTDLLADENTALPKCWIGSTRDGSFDNPLNWTGFALPDEGEDVAVISTAETAITVAGDYTLGTVKVPDGTVAFGGTGVMTAGGVSVASGAVLATGGRMRFAALPIPSGATVEITGAEGLADGGLTGAGTLVVDPGAGNTFTMTKSNTDFTGEAVVKSGTVAFGDLQSFGPVKRASCIRVKGGATLDEAGALDDNKSVFTDKNRVVLEEGSRLVSGKSTTDTRAYPVTMITLEGNATVDTSVENVGIGASWHDWYSYINLGTNTLTITGGNIFHVSICEIGGTGTIDIQSGSKVYSTHEYDNEATVTTCNNGTICIREGAVWHLYNYHGHDGNLSVKNLLLDGAVTRAGSGSTLTVTGSITGKGTTPTLTMGSGAVFKPNGTDYLTVTESLSGEMAVDASGLDFEGRTDPVPLFRMGSSEVLPAISSVSVSGAPPEWHLQQTADGCGYDLVRKPGLAIRLK